ncbi:hypothetical protein L6452_42518 [Arctium lappa]|uniref:Uncharacterized protein n=1 Tax=Arctium lappa TaxID=4217 RepID=A0ACB8XHZ5_ARCLA|nr:hypothetical protein L6452_42518 [Arctium lappa]
MFFSIQLPSPSSTSMKFKTLVQSFIFSKLSCVTVVLAKTKLILTEFVEETNLKNIHILVPLMFKKNKNKNKNKLNLSSFKFYYNWSSSHLVPKSSIIYDGYVSYDPMWDSFEEEALSESSDLSRYLHWLEEKNNGAYDINEIDNLADKFIANCHQKFILEKQESDRRFQEMMARSV